MRRKTKERIKELERIERLERQVWDIQNPQLYFLTDEVEYKPHWKDKQWTKGKVAKVEVLEAEEKFYYRIYTLFTEGIGLSGVYECDIRKPAKK